MPYIYTFVRARLETCGCFYISAFCLQSFDHDWLDTGMFTSTKFTLSLAKFSHMCQVNALLVNKCSQSSLLFSQELNKNNTAEAEFSLFILCVNVLAT